MQKAPDMVVVKADFEMAVNDFADAGSGPQLIGPTVSRGTLRQKIFQPLQLRRRQLGRTMRMGLCSQRSRATRGGLVPAIYRRAIHTQKFRNVHGPLALLQKFNPAPPSSFEFRCCSNWPAHTHLDA